MMVKCRLSLHGAAISKNVSRFRICEDVADRTCNICFIQLPCLPTGQALRLTLKVFSDLRLSDLEAHWHPCESTDVFWSQSLLLALPSSSFDRDQPFSVAELPWWNCLPEMYHVLIFPTFKLGPKYRLILQKLLKLIWLFASALLLFLFYCCSIDVLWLCVFILLSILKDWLQREHMFW